VLKNPLPTADQQLVPSRTGPPNRIALDTYDFLLDPRTLPLAERRAVRDRLAREHAMWQARLCRLTEAGGPDDDFPAFLLATPPFAAMARSIGHATRRRDLPPAVADELDWFLLAFADYLRTDDGEDVFADRRLTG
jgi:hypothetical protein